MSTPAPPVFPGYEFPDVSGALSETSPPPLEAKNPVWTPQGGNTTGLPEYDSESSSGSLPAPTTQDPAQEGVDVSEGQPGNTSLTPLRGFDPPPADGGGPTDDGEQVATLGIPDPTFPAPPPSAWTPPPPTLAPHPRDPREDGTWDPGEGTGYYRAATGEGWQWAGPGSGPQDLSTSIGFDDPVAAWQQLLNTLGIPLPDGLGGGSMLPPADPNSGVDGGPTPGPSGTGTSSTDPPPGPEQPPTDGGGDGADALWDPFSEPLSADSIDRFLRVVTGLEPNPHGYDVGDLVRYQGLLRDAGLLPEDGAATPGTGTDLVPPDTDTGTDPPPGAPNPNFLVSLGYDTWLDLESGATYTSEQLGPLAWDNLQPTTQADGTTRKGAIVVAADGRSVRWASDLPASGVAGTPTSGAYLSFEELRQRGIKRGWDGDWTFTPEVLPPGYGTIPSGYEITSFADYMASQGLETYGATVWDNRLTGGPPGLKQILQSQGINTNTSGDPLGWRYNEANKRREHLKTLEGFLWQNSPDNWNPQVVGVHALKENLFLLRELAPQVTASAYGYSSPGSATQTTAEGLRLVGNRLNAWGWAMGGDELSMLKQLVYQAERPGESDIWSADGINITAPAARGEATYYFGADGRVSAGTSYMVTNGQRALLADWQSDVWHDSGGGLVSPEALGQRMASGFYDPRTGRAIINTDTGNPIGYDLAADYGWYRDGHVYNKSGHHSWFEPFGGLVTPVEYGGGADVSLAAFYADGGGGVKRVESANTLGSFVLGALNQFISAWASEGFGFPGTQQQADPWNEEFFWQETTSPQGF